MKCWSEVKGVLKIRNAVMPKAHGPSAIPKPTKDRECWRWKRATPPTASRPKRCRKSAKKLADTRRALGQSATLKARWRGPTKSRQAVIRPANRRERSRKSAKPRWPSPPKVRKLPVVTEIKKLKSRQLQYSHHWNTYRLIKKNESLGIST